MKQCIAFETSNKAMKYSVWEKKSFAILLSMRIFYTNQQPIYLVLRFYYYSVHTFINRLACEYATRKSNKTEKIIGIYSMALWFYCIFLFDSEERQLKVACMHTEKSANDESKESNKIECQMPNQNKTIKLMRDQSPKKPPHIAIYNAFG